MMYMQDVADTMHGGHERHFSTAEVQNTPLCLHQKGTEPSAPNDNQPFSSPMPSATGLQHHLGKCWLLLYNRERAAQLNAQQHTSTSPMQN
jgi:hypothetical protein